ncbi:hypothetical protein IBA8402_33050 [Pseudomonas syringae]
MVVKNPRLQRCQRVDVLHIGSTAGHVLRHAVDLRLSEADQRQQIRGDVFATFGNQVGRHHDVRAAIDCCGKRRHGRLAEQHMHIGTQTDIAHLLDQFHRQQRVAAQLEEVIMTTHLFNLEHVDPDRRQQRFHFALRRFVTTADQRLRIRSRQCLAIQLAVGRQGQAVQLHKSAGNHVFGQVFKQLFAQVFGGDRFATQVGHQTLAVRLCRVVCAGNHYHFTHTGAQSQSGLDFADLDTQAADLHLEVITAQVFQRAIGQPAAHVAGFV